MPVNKSGAAVIAPVNVFTHAILVRAEKGTWSQLGGRLPISGPSIEPRAALTAFLLLLFLLFHELVRIQIVGSRRPKTRRPASGSSTKKQGRGREEPTSQAPS